MKNVRVLFLLDLCFAFYLPPLAAQEYKILQVNSYGSDWVWIKEQHQGFVQGLDETEAEIRSIDLDAKNKDQAGVKAMVKKSIALIDEWKPDLLFVTDDLAQQEISIRYINTTIQVSSWLQPTRSSFENRSFFYQQDSRGG